MPLAGVTTRVDSDRSRAGELIFSYSLELKGDLSEAQRSQLYQVAEQCKVGRALAGKISVQREAAGAV